MKRNHFEHKYKHNHDHKHQEHKYFEHFFGYKYKHNHFEHKYKHNHDHGDKFEHFLGDKHKRDHFEHKYKNNHDHEHQQHLEHKYWSGHTNEWANEKNYTDNITNDTANQVVEDVAAASNETNDLETISHDSSVTRSSGMIPSAAALQVEEWALGRQVSRAWRSLCDNMVARLDTLHEAEATSYMQEMGTTIFG